MLSRREASPAGGVVAIQIHSHIKDPRELAGELGPVCLGEVAPVPLDEGDELEGVGDVRVGVHHLLHRALGEQGAELAAQAAALLAGRAAGPGLPGQAVALPAAGLVSV